MSRAASQLPEYSDPEDTDDHHGRGNSLGGANVISPPPNGTTYGSTAPTPNYEEEVDMYTNHDVIEKAFAECDLTGEGRLHYQEFKMWVNRNPAILDYFQELLPYSGMCLIKSVYEMIVIVLQDLSTRLQRIESQLIRKKYCLILVARILFVGTLV